MVRVLDGRLQPRDIGRLKAVGSFTPDGNVTRVTGRIETVGPWLIVTRSPSAPAGSWPSPAATVWWLEGDPGRALGLLLTGAWFFALAALNGVFGERRAVADARTLHAAIETLATR